MYDAGYGNATNTKEHNSQNQSGILFPVAEEISRTETDLIAMIKTTGKEKDYELIEYILNVNTQYTQVLMELNENGAMDAVYTYGVSRLTEDRFTGESNFYLYDPAGNVAGITDQDGYLWQSYRYDAFGNATFGSPQYDNEYTFNAESYNPNIRSQYLRARYYDMVKGNFLTEDSYLGDIRNPLTLNRYSYCIGNPLFYDDPSGHDPTPVGVTDSDAVEAYTIRVIMEHQNEVNRVMDNVFNWFGDIPGLDNTSTANQVLNGFATGFVSSYYATWDAITSPEYICASLDYMLRHPVETVTGIAKNAISGSDIGGRIYQDIKAEDYRAAAQKVGYEVGKLSQVVLARAAIKKCGDLFDKKRGETLSPPVNEGGSGATAKSNISSEMKDKILEGQRVGTSNKIIGGHSANAVNNNSPNFAVEDVRINPDGTRVVKYYKQFPDGNVSRLKTSTLFPEGWSDDEIINSIQNIADSKPIGVRPTDGQTLHRGTVNGVEIDVIKQGIDVISGYPVGGKPTPGFDPVN